MEYKRLTERNKDGVAVYKKKCDGGSVWENEFIAVERENEVLDRLAELEDKIEQGTLKEEKTCVYQEYNDGDWSYWECSNCGEPFCFNNECTPEENQYHYCPNCGARITEYKELQNG